jgi:hypothetical protein
MTKTIVSILAEKHLGIKDIETDPMKGTQVYVETDKLIELVHSAYSCGKVSSHES